MEINKLYFVGGDKATKLGELGVSRWRILTTDKKECFIYGIGDLIRAINYSGVTWTIENDYVYVEICENGCEDACKFKEDELIDNLYEAVVWLNERGRLIIAKYEWHDNN